MIRRQHAVEPYILDFYCPQARLAIEVDGWTHALPEQIAHDERRTAFLRAQEIEVLRIPAAEIMRDADEAAENIWRIVLETIAARAAG